MSTILRLHDGERRGPTLLDGGQECRALLLAHVFAGLFYLMMTSGCAWIAGAYLRERGGRRAAAEALVDGELPRAKRRGGPVRQ